MHPRVVPWTGFPEWLYVADRIFSENEEELSEALLVANAWLVRGNYPPAVETTVNIRKLLRDGSAHRIDARTLQLALASCLVRFVNEVVDPLQQGTYALPVSHLAERKNLSRILVDIRHSATHDVLPSLENLCVGAELALDWLREYYWDVQRDYSVMVRETTEAVLKRFADGLVECDPLSRTVEVFAQKCLQDLPRLENSPDIQLPFLLALFESMAPITTIMPLIESVARKTDSIAASVLEVAKFIRPEEIVGQRFTLIVSASAKHIKTVHTLAKCMKTCFQLIEYNGANLLQVLVEHHKVIDPPRQLCELGDCLVSSSTASSYPMSSFALVEKAVKFFDECTEGRTMLFANTEGWTVPVDWTPLPFGCTMSFNPITSFKDLYHHHHHHSE